MADDVADDVGVAVPEINALQVGVICINATDVLDHVALDQGVPVGSEPEVDAV
jgi:hypothetical protein